MKKLLMFILVVSIVSSMIVPAFAYGQDEVDVDLKDLDIVRMESMGHGEFKVSNNQTSLPTQKSMSAVSTETGDFVFAEKVDSDEELKISSNKYLIKVDSDTYLLTNKINIDTNNFEKCESMLQEYNVEEQHIKNIQQVIEFQKELKNNDFCVEIYVPDTYDNDANTLSAETETAYYTYTDKWGQRWSMRDIVVKYSNVWTTAVTKEGTTAKAKSDAFINVVISGVGLVSPPIAVFGVGKSLYDLYVAARGPVVSCRSTDQSISAALFDRKEKLSQYYAPALAKYVDGKTSHKVWMNKLETRQLYNGNKNPFDRTLTINKVEYSQYWDNNAMTIQPYGWEDYLKFKMYDTNVKLDGKS